MANDFNAAGLVWVLVDPMSAPDADRCAAHGVGAIELRPDGPCDPGALAERIAELKRSAPAPLPVCVAQEGGRFAALSEPFLRLPTMGAVGLSGELSLAATIGEAVARELRAVGIDANLAPVLDVDTREDNPLIGDRSFGISPHVCGAFGCGLLEAHQARGVAAVAKHFPGLGDLAADPRLGPARIEHGWDRLDRVELPPFFNALDRGVAGVLVGHAVFDAIDPDAPASRSPAIVDACLRDRLEYDGFVLAEDVAQPAAGSDPGAAAVDAVIAGCDAVRLATADALDDVVAALRDAIDADRIPPQRLQNARRRRDALIHAFVQGPVNEPELSCIGGDEHRALAQRVRAAAEGR